MRSATALLSVMVAAGCVADDSGERDAAAVRQEAAEEGRVATVYATGSDRLSPEELEAARLRMDWRRWVERDTAAGPAADSAAAVQPAVHERWDDITMASVNGGPVALPLFGDVEGPGVLRVQVLLDRVRFSPGIIDGRWGRNTEKAVYWFQRQEHLRPTGHVDEATWRRLKQRGGAVRQLVRTHTLTEDDVAGPFVSLPAEYYDRRDLACQCYESLAEKLAETHHTTEDLLRQLNPGIDLNGVRAGMQLNVPAVSDVAIDDGGADSVGNAAGRGIAVSRLVVSDGGGYVHALDAGGRILYHFPATLGSAYSPSPDGDFRITNIARDPSWHYQPELLEGVDDTEPDAVLPAGPNNAVGVVWMQLSRPHYGIHGTSAPETIGYATSNGCVRLTNWDAAFLAQRVRPDTPVEFRDVD